MLETTQEAPDFELENQDGEPVQLSDYRGQTVVLYFYPKAGTRGCTLEAESFRDQWAAFEDRDIVVLGVSNNSIDDLKAFQQEHNLPHTLLSDPDGVVASQYETYGTAEIRGEEWEIAFRNTYVIDENGVIEAVYEDVTPEGHAEEILAEL